MKTKEEWVLEPASKKQIKFLRKLGWKSNKKLTKGEAQIKTTELLKK